MPQQDRSPSANTLQSTRGVTTILKHPPMYHKRSKIWFLDIINVINLSELTNIWEDGLSNEELSSYVAREISNHPLLYDKKPNV